MSLTVIQWNLKGYVNNYSQLLILIKKYSPHIISLQETHIQHTNTIPTPINYKLLTNIATNRFGGVRILVHKSIQYTTLNITSDPEAIAINIQSKIKLNIFSTYISPTKNISDQTLQNTFNIQQTPSLITGDFNGWHPSWGSPTTNTRGKITQRFIDNTHLILLNDKSPTHFSTHNTYSHIDLTLCSPILAPHANWKILNDLHGSDHFPIITTLFPTTNTQKFNRPFFKLKEANWDQYSAHTQQINEKYPTSQNVNKEAAQINRIILYSANLSIPQTSPNAHPTGFHGGTSTSTNCESKNNLRWKKLNRTITLENIIDYRRKNAKFRYELKKRKKEASSSFTSTIHPTTPSSKIWTNIRRFCGLNPIKQIHAISSPENNETTLASNEIANIFAQHLSELSGDWNFSEEFRNNKYRNNLHNYTPSPIAQTIEKNITYLELISALQTLKGSAPGLNRISYQMIKNSSPTTKHRITKLFNEIFNSHIPQAYKTSLIIPILKPNTDKTKTTSYRPISLNCCIAKKLDKIIAKRLWWLVTHSNLLSENQFGFKKGKSTSDCLLYVDYLITKSKMHTSLVTLDFSRAFDRVGVHSIIHQLQEWKTGPKIINYIQNFMINRKIIVRVGPHTSSPLPLSNGIPLGSPISVILFLIAFNKLSNIISLYKEIKFNAYADDFFLIINFKKNTNISLDNLLNDIGNWGSYSGASLSLSKCQHLHICKKHHCTSKISCNNIQIPTVTSLKILGITINNKYKWNTHIYSLLPKLYNKLNIIKCLSSPKFNCNTLSLLNVAKATVIAKLEYGLFLYGHAPKSILNKLKTPFNSAIRLALGAYRSTPINNLLYESNIPSLEMKRDLQIAKLSQNLSFCKNRPIHKFVRHKKYKKKTLSIIDQTIKLSLELNLPYKPIKLHKYKPSWDLPNLIDTSLRGHKKQETSPESYRKLFEHTKNKLKPHSFIFTDGSKINCIITFAITTDTNILKQGILPPYSSVLTSETIAILEAIELIKTRRGKFGIWFDSLSAIDSIKNPNNNSFYPNRIRSLITQLAPKIKIMWIPGHSGIIGNELADQAAKLASNMPLIVTPNINNTDIKRHLKAELATKQKENIINCNQWYQSLNTNNTHTCDYLKQTHQNWTRLDQIKIIRLRLGHTNITHQHYLNPNPITVCPFCQGDLSISHILNSCPSLIQTKQAIFRTLPLDLLSKPNPENIQKILVFLKKTRIIPPNFKKKKQMYNNKHSNHLTN
uniref:Pol protein n=1 Tax=Drosophila teissieri TaxID=7243 RepID=Q24690_DROTE|nr:unknown protein [Drosophila teissieri]